MTAIFITSIRIIVAPVFAYVFISSYNNENASHMLIFSLFLLAIIELSDALDGYIARKKNQVSDFGKLFDPFADSISRLTIFSSFLIKGIIPIWMFFIFLYRDSFVVAIRHLCIKKNVVLAARISGKLKAIFQAIGSFGVVGISLAHCYEIDFIPYEIYGKHPGFFIMLLPALVTIYSLIDYWLGNKTIIFGKD